VLDIKLELSPYQRFLGVELVSAEEGAVEIRLPFREEFLRLEGSDWYHGGVVSALADIAGAYAVYSAVGDGGATIDLRVDWLRPALRGDLVASGRAVKIGRRVCVADVEVRDAESNLLAVARGLFASPSQIPS
jgi:uncharacterized protein (TIGR00369 family)